MKKLLLTSAIIICAAGFTAANGGTYTPEYITHLKNCSVHTEKYNAEIPTDDPNTPVIHLKSTETILGWREGKCLTESKVFSVDMNQDIISTKCAFSEKQLESIVKKMETAQKSGKADDKKELQEEMTKLVQDTSTCQINNLLKTD